MVILAFRLLLFFGRVGGGTCRNRVRLVGLRWRSLKRIRIIGNGKHNNDNTVGSVPEIAAAAHYVGRGRDRDRRRIRDEHAEK